MGMLDQKIALVTGATQGIGTAIARLFGAEGATVIVAGILDQDGANTVAEIESSGGRACYIHLDVTRESDWEAAVNLVRMEFGGLDILVNNAGIFQVRPIEDTSEEEWDQMQRVNVEGTWLGVRFAFREMTHAGRGGAIVNISSLRGLSGAAGMIAYCGTKGAVTTMTKAAALEGAALKPPIRVNSIHPGTVMTNMLTSMGDAEELQKLFADKTPIGRFSRPEEIAQAVLFLASDDASYMVGAELNVDGGLGAG